MLLVFFRVPVLKHGDSKTSVFYTRRFFFKRPITQWNCNRRWKYFRVWIRWLGTTNLWKENRFRKSHATVPLKEDLIPFLTIFDPVDFRETSTFNANQQKFNFLSGINHRRSGSKKSHVQITDIVPYIFSTQILRITFICWKIFGLQNCTNPQESYKW